MSFTCFFAGCNKEEKTENVKVLAFVTTKASDGCEDIVFNPNVFTEFKLAGSPEVFPPFCLFSTFNYNFTFSLHLCKHCDCPFISLWCACVENITMPRSIIFLHYCF